MLRVWCRMPGTSEATNALALADADDHRRAETRDHNLVRLGGRQHASAKAPVRRLTAWRTAASSGIGAPAACSVQLDLLDEVGNDLGIGLGDEFVALRSEFVFQIKIVLDNAVVDYDDAAGAVAMGMGILFSGAAVRSPASVADAKSAFNRIARGESLQGW